MANTHLESCVFYAIGMIRDKFISKHRKIEASELLLWAAIAQKKSIPYESMYYILSYLNIKFGCVFFKNFIKEHSPKEVVAPIYHKLLKEQGLFNSYIASYLSDNRHLSTEAQHAYDNQYGLVLY